MNSLKAAMVVTVLAISGFFTMCLTSCSKDSSSSSDQGQKEETQTSEAAKTVLTCYYTFGDSLLEYVDAKIIYTDAAGKQQTEVVDRSKCTREKVDDVMGYEETYKLDITATTFPNTLKAKIEITPKAESVLANAKTGTTVVVAQKWHFTITDKNEKVIDSGNLTPTGAVKYSGTRLGPESIKDGLAEILTYNIQAAKMDKEFSLTTDKAGKIDYDLK